MKVLKPVNSHFMAVLNVNNYRVQKEYEEYNDHTLGKIAKRAMKIDVQTKAAVYKLSDPISVFLFLDNT